VGVLRLGGWASRWATIEAGGRRWGVARRGLLRTVIQATDPAGTVVGAYEGRSLQRGGTLRWEGRDYRLGPSSRWKERYALAGEDERALDTLEGTWGKRPVRVELADGVTIEPGLLLFAAFVVRTLADDAASAAA
jgi:hypothetical protein